MSINLTPRQYRDLILAGCDIIVYEPATQVDVPPTLWLLVPDPAVECGCAHCLRRLGQALGTDRVPLRPDLTGLTDPDPYVVVDDAALIPETVDRLIMWTAEQYTVLSPAECCAMVTGSHGYRMEVRVDSLAIVAPSIAELQNLL